MSPEGTHCIRFDDGLDDWFGYADTVPLSIYAGFVVLAAVLLYFVWEGAPWHRNLGAESAYLGTCLVCSAVATVCAHHPLYDVRPNAGAKIADVIILVALTHLYVQQVKLKPLPPFYSENDLRPYARRQVRHKLSRRLAKDLNRQIGKLVKDEEKNVIWLRASSLPAIVLFLVVAQRACFRFRGAAEWLVHTHFWIAGVILATWAAQEIRDWCRQGPARQKIESMIDRVVLHQQKDLLNDLLQTIDVPTLLLCGPRNLQDRLTKDALDLQLLEPFTKAVLLNALQKIGITSRRAAVVSRLVLSSKGSELMELKSALDSTGDYFNLYKLIFRDLREAGRKPLLRHLSQEAEQLRAGGAVGLKILSDIDDTAFCGGSFPAGCDKRLPRKMLYPGFAQLLRELDSSFVASEPCSNVVFLSARPHIYKDLSEQKTFRTVHHLFEHSMMHTIPSMLAGSFRIGFGALIKNLLCNSAAWEDVGRYKNTVFQQYAQLYKEYDFIFLGDNGQGDLLAGQLMMEGPEDARPVAILIHEVLPREQALTLDEEEPCAEKLSAQGIHLHRSYAGAALALHRAGRLSLQQLASVAKCAQDDFDTSRVIFPEWLHNWDAFEADLSADLLVVSRLLSATGLTPLRCLECTSKLLQQEPFASLFEESSSEEESIDGGVCSTFSTFPTLGKAPRRSRLWHFIDQSESE